ncbi:MAG: transposase [Desulfobacteraceae bacterium]
MVTSNHIHLLVFDAGGRNVIPDSIKLLAGRTAQEFNQRKNRKGAFWEDRYHATAVECDNHLIQCLIYIDMNMVRAGVVNHPLEWEFSGFNEIQNPKKRYSIIDHSTLMNLLQFSSVDHLKAAHMNWISDTLSSNNSIRQEKWTQSIAVGSRGFLETIKERLNSKARGRMIIESGHESHELREEQAIYAVEPDDIKRRDHYESQENVYSWM